MAKHTLIERDPETLLAYEREVEMEGVQDAAASWFEANPSCATLVYTDSAGRDRYVTRRTVLEDVEAARLVVNDKLLNA
jgi:hypothetical protein